MMPERLGATMREIPVLLAMAAAIAPFLLDAAPAAGVHVGLELPPGPDNPRNSEGSFVSLRDGRILFAYSRFSGTSGGDNATADIAARYSSDMGRSWTTNDEIIVRNEGGMNVMSVSLLRLQSGEIALFYVRKNSESDCRPVLRRSFDEGRTWSEPQPSQFISPLSPASVKRLPTGDLLAIWNDHAARPEMKTRGPAWARGARTPLAAAISRDDGATWDQSRLLEDDPDGWFCYTAIHPLDDGTVLLAYGAYGMLTHSRVVKVPMDWLYGKSTYLSR